MKIKVVNKGENELPEYASSGAAGEDLMADFTDLAPVMVYKSKYKNGKVTIGHGGVALIYTGLYVEIPKGYEIQIRSRSGLAKRGLVVANSPGTIDPDYRGNIGIILYNFGKKITVSEGDRIAQAILAKVYRIEWEKTDSLSFTERADKGFGSTGVWKEQ